MILGKPIGNKIHYKIGKLWDLTDDLVHDNINTETWFLIDKSIWFIVNFEVLQELRYKVLESQMV